MLSIGQHGVCSTHRLRHICNATYHAERAHGPAFGPTGRRWYGSGVASLVEQWDSLVAHESEDWSHLAIDVALDDDERLEEAALLMCAANPWHGQTWRSGVLSIRVARTVGYGVSAPLLRGLLGRCDEAAIAGSLHRTASFDAAVPVGQQGPIV